MTGFDMWRCGINRIKNKRSFRLAFFGRFRNKTRIELISLG